MALDGAQRLGAKILISGGSRCNVTNVVVTERDFWGGKRPIVRRVLRAFTAAEAALFFREIGVALHEGPRPGAGAIALIALQRAPLSRGTGTTAEAMPSAATTSART